MVARGSDGEWSVARRTHGCFGRTLPRCGNAPCWRRLASGNSLQPCSRICSDAHDQPATGRQAPSSRFALLEGRPSTGVPTYRLVTGNSTSGGRSDRNWRRKLPEICVIGTITSVIEAPYDYHHSAWFAGSQPGRRCISALPQQRRGCRGCRLSSPVETRFVRIRSVLSKSCQILARRDNLSTAIRRGRDDTRDSGDVRPRRRFSVGGDWMKAVG